MNDASNSVKSGPKTKPRAFIQKSMPVSVVGEGGSHPQAYRGARRPSVRRLGGTVMDPTARVIQLVIAIWHVAGCKQILLGGSGHA